MASFSIGLLTRNNSLDFELSQAKNSQKKLFSTIIRNFGLMSSNNASAMTSTFSQSCSSNLTNKTQVITLDTFKKFLETRQMEAKSDSGLKMIIEVSFPLEPLFSHSTVGVSQIFLELLKLINSPPPCQPKIHKNTKLKFCKVMETILFSSVTNQINLYALKTY